MHVRARANGATRTAASRQPPRKGQRARTAAVWSAASGISRSRRDRTALCMGCFINSSLFPYIAVSCRMAIVSGQAWPAIAHMNVHNKWPKMPRGKSNNSPRVAKPTAIVFHPFPHFHHRSSPPMGLGAPSPRLYSLCLTFTYECDRSYLQTCIACLAGITTTSPSV